MDELYDLISKGGGVEVTALGELEGKVWRKVSQVEARRRELRLRTAALCLAAGVGGLAGSISGSVNAGGRNELSIFSVELVAAPLNVRNLTG